MISPTRKTTMPMAKPTGQRLGPGTWGWSSWLSDKALVGIQAVRADEGQRRDKRGEL
jgi:hypothetical protein